MRRHRQEETWNAVTHAFGVGMCFSFFVTGTPATKIISAMLCCTFFCSVLYHGTERGSRKSLYRMLDMASIHATIACTSIAYLFPHNLLYWCVLCLFAGAVGCQYIVSHYGTKLLERAAVKTFVANGLLCLSIVLFSSAPLSSMFIVGCAVYLVGLYFYIHDYVPYYHTVWHIFVLFASLMHILGTM